MINSGTNKVFNCRNHEANSAKCEGSIYFGVPATGNRHPVVTHDGHDLNIFAICGDMHHHYGICAPTADLVYIRADLSAQIGRASCRARETTAQLDGQYERKYDTN